MSQRLSFKRLFKAVPFIKGASSRLLFPVGIHRIQVMLHLTWLYDSTKSYFYFIAFSDMLSGVRRSEIGNL